MDEAYPIFTAGEAVKATGGVLLSGSSQDKLCGITTDSRAVNPGNLFIAIAGEKYDGHDFIQTAVQKGAAGVLVQDEDVLRQAGIGEEKVVIRVADTLQALGDLAYEYRMRFSIPVIGLTGSSGKTTTKEMIAAIIGIRKKVLVTEGNFNNLIGLPQTIFRLTGEHELAVLEMGTNCRGEIGRLARIAAPDVGLITNIGPAHLAGFGSVENVREEKGSLFLNMAPSGTAVINLDDEAVRTVAVKWTGRRITYGMSIDADVTARNIEKNGARSMRFTLVIGDKSENIEMKVVGIHNVYNALAAAATAWAVGIDCRTIVEGLSKFRPVSGRMQVIKLQNCAFVLDDSYNANPASVREALMTVKDLKNNHNSYVFLGDMLELGTFTEEMHRKIGILVATIGVNALFLRGEFASITAAGALEGGMPAQNIFLLSANEDGMDFLKKNLKRGDIILVKGSRCMKMEEFAARIYDVFGVDKDEAKINTKSH